MLANDLLCIKGFIIDNNLYSNNKTYKLCNLFVAKGECLNGFFQIICIGNDYYKLIRNIVLDRTNIEESVSEQTM